MGLFSGKLDFEINEHGLITVDKVMIGEIEQTILIQAEDMTKPILLFLPRKIVLLFVGNFVRPVPRRGI